MENWIKLNENTKSLLEGYAWTACQNLKDLESKSNTMIITEVDNAPYHAAAWEEVVYDGKFAIRLIEPKAGIAINAKNSTSVLFSKDTLYEIKNTMNRKNRNGQNKIKVIETIEDILIVDRLPNEKYLVSEEDLGKLYKVSPLNKWKKPTKDEKLLNQFDSFLESDLTDLKAQLFDNANQKKSKEIKIKRTFEEGYIKTNKTHTKGQIISAELNTNVVKKQMFAFKTFLKNRRQHNANFFKMFDEGYYEKETPRVITETDLDWKILKSIEREGTAEQREFVLNVLNSEDFTVLNGPPGSGKTTSIFESIYHLAKQGLKVGVIASTHVAVDNIIEKIHEYNTQSTDKSFQETIVPIRLGDSNVVSTVSQEYLLSGYTKRITGVIRRNIQNKEDRTEGQQYLLESLKTGQGLDFDTEFVDFVNVTCATPVGMLRHPQLKGKAYTSNIKLFDVLIVDEASKMTLQEFSVSAMLSERFVIVGDLEQLTPYTEQAEVEQNLSRGFGEKVFIGNEEYEPTESERRIYKEYLRYLFEQDRYYSRNPNGNFTPWIVLSEKQISEEFTKFLNQLTKDKEVSTKTSPVFDFMNATHIQTVTSEFIVMTEQQLKDEENEIERLPLNFIIQKEGFKSLNGSIKNETFGKTWEEELSWRLITDFSGSNPRTKRHVRLLNPKVQRKKNGTIYDNSISEIENAKLKSLPSILQMMKGINSEADKRNIEPARNQEKMNIFKNNWLGPKKETLLKYQNRMHKEIADISKEIFYKGEALNTSAFVNAEKSKFSNIIPDFRGDALQRNNFIEIKTNNGHHSYVQEAKLVNEMLDTLVSKMKVNGFDKPVEIGVISYYNAAQRINSSLIKERIDVKYKGDKEPIIRIDGKPAIKVNIKTIDKYQGHEADIVFILLGGGNSTVFFDNGNRLNVAITRARYQNIMIGQSHFRNKRNKNRILSKVIDKYRIIENHKKGN